MEKFILNPDADSLEELFGVTSQRADELSGIIATKLTEICRAEKSAPLDVITKLFPLAKTEGETMFVAIQAGRSMEKLTNIFRGKDDLSPLVKLAQTLNKMKSQF